MAARSTSNSGLSRRSMLSLGALGLGGLALGACDSPIAAATAPSGSDLVIGACLELTGPYAAIGTAQRDALMVVQSMIRDQGGFVVDGRTRQVSLVVADNAGSPQRAAANTRSLVGSHNVAAIIGATGADTSLAMAPITESLSTPMLSLSADGAVTDPIAQRRWVFKLGPDASDVADRLASTIKQAHRSQVAVIAASDGHGDDGLAALVTSFETAGGLQNISTVRIPASTPMPGHYASQAAAVAAARPDAVIVWALAPASGAAAQALRTAGYAGPVYFDTGAAATDTLTNVRPAQFDGVYIVSPRILGGTNDPATTPDDVARRAFYLRYTQRDAGFDGLAVYAGDALRMLVTAATLGQSFARSVLRDQMESTTFAEFSGAYAFSTISHGGVQPDSLAVFQLKSAGWLQIS